MTKEDLSFVADALLALTEEEESAPFHTEEKLLAKMKRDQDRRVCFRALIASSCASDELLEREYQEVFQSAMLTKIQGEVLWLRLTGNTFEDIGRMRSHSKQAAQRIFVQALKKLAHSYNVYPYNGLSDVYRKEVHRGLR